MTGSDLIYINIFYSRRKRNSIDVDVAGDEDRRAQIVASHAIQAGDALQLIARPASRACWLILQISLPLTRYSSATTFAFSFRSISHLPSSSASAIHAGTTALRAASEI